MAKSLSVSFGSVRSSFCVTTGVLKILSPTSVPTGGKFVNGRPLNQAIECGTQRAAGLPSRRRREPEAQCCRITLQDPQSRLGGGEMALVEDHHVRPGQRDALVHDGPAMKGVD